MPYVQQIRRRPDMKRQSLAQGLTQAGQQIGQGLMNYGMQQSRMDQYQARTDAMAQKTAQTQINNAVKLGADPQNRALARTLIQMQFGDAAEPFLAETEKRWSQIDAAPKIKTDKEIRGSADAWINEQLINRDESGGGFTNDDILKQWPAYRHNWSMQTVADPSDGKAVLRAYRNLDQTLIDRGLLHPDELKSDEELMHIIRELTPQTRSSLAEGLGGAAYRPTNSITEGLGGAAAAKASNELTKPGGMAGFVAQRDQALKKAMAHIDKGFQTGALNGSPQQAAAYLNQFDDSNLTVQQKAKIQQYYRSKLRQ